MQSGGKADMQFANLAAASILDAANDYIRERGGKQCLFLGGPGFLRMARSYGYEPRALGGIVCNSSGRFLAFACPTRGTIGALRPDVGRGAASVK